MRVASRSELCAKLSGYTTIPADVRPSIARSSQSNQHEAESQVGTCITFYAQKAIELGFDLPLPFSFSIMCQLICNRIGFSDL